MYTLKALDALVAELPDHEWFGPGADTAGIIETVRDAAQEQGCTSFSIFSIPDPVFPVYHGQKKRVHTEQLFDGPKFVLSCTHHVEVASAHWSTLEAKGREKFLKTIMDIVAIKGRTNPGDFEIFTVKGDGSREYIERGAVS